MSTKVVWLAVAAALCLVVAALVMTARTPTTAPASGGRDSAAFNPAQVASITVRRADGREERAERTPAGEWVYVAGRVLWPAIPPDTVPAALAALPAELEKEAPSPIEAGGATITLGLRDGSAVAMRLAPKALAGRTAAAVTTASGTRHALIENSVLDPLLNPGPAGWRVRDALPGVRLCSRLMLDDGRSPLSLARIEGQWLVRRPVNARASRRAVDALIASLAEIRAARFVDDRGGPDLAALGLTRPALTITAETDERSAEGTAGVRVRTVVRELIVGGPADPRGDTRFASTDPDGSIIMVLPASAVNALSLAPRGYLHPIPVAVSPADVSMATILDTTAPPGAPGAQRGYRREGGGWSETSPTGSRRATDPRPIDDLLVFLTSRPGEPDPVQHDDDMRALRKIELIDAEGDAREILTAGYTADGEFALRAGNVMFSYPASAAPAILNLPPFDRLPPAPPATPAPTMPADAPVWK